MVPTLVFCAMFLYWYRPSFADFPFLRSTHSSTNRIITGSRDVMGLLRDRLEVTCSWRRESAAADWPTAMSSCARCISNSTSAIGTCKMKDRVIDCDVIWVFDWVRKETHLEHILRFSMGWRRHAGQPPLRTQLLLVDSIAVDNV